jgi:RNA polymerase sigma factor (sigma-70 family)
VSDPASSALEDLAARAARGDSSAVDELVGQIRPRVLRHCGRMLPYPEDAEDACQETLLRVSQRVSSFDGRSLFVTWLYQVTGNTCRDAYRRMRVRAEQVVESLPERPNPRTTSIIAGSRLDILDALERLETVHANWVTPFILRDICDQEYADIADHLGRPLGTVKRQIYDARRWLRNEV